MDALHQWITRKLIEWNVINSADSYLDNIIILFLIFFLAFCLDFICRKIVPGLFQRMAARTQTSWDDLLFERKIVHKFLRIIPALVVYLLLPLAFLETEILFLLVFLQKLCLIYIIAVSVRLVNAMLNLVNEIYNRRQPDRSIKGFIQVVQAVVFFIGIIIIIALLIEQSPAKLIAGLGASAAILMLIFKDSILGFVAGVQLSMNDMLRPGDWITMNKYGADGTVIDVTLNAIKVRNFDNTIVTIPPYSLVSDSFQNWRGMSDSPGRRVKRSVNIDMNSVRFCTPEMLAKFRKMALLTGYIDCKEAEPQGCHAAATNLGVFRIYLERYLGSYPMVNTDLTCVVHYLQLTEKGIPVELYFFLSEKRFAEHEHILADIFDHILAILPEFGLRVFQSISGADVRALKATP